MYAQIHRVVQILVLGTIVAAAAGCNDSLAPYQPEITNATDNFQLQATGLKRVTDTKEYTWQMSGTTANVNQATVLTAGTATLEIRDNAGTVVYNKSLTANGTYTTSVGAAGTWKIRVILVKVGGTLNFRVQKP